MLKGKAQQQHEYHNQCIAVVTNFTLIVIKHAQETPIYATVWKYCNTEWMCDAGENKLLVMVRIQLEIHLLGPNRGMLMPLTKHSAVGTGKT